MKMFVKILDKIVSGLVAVFLATILIIGTMQIISRHFFNMPLVWVDELSKYLFIWFAFLGAAYGVRKHQHVVADLVVNNLPPKLQRFVEIVMDLLSVMLFLLFTLLTPNLMKFARTEISSTVRIPLSYVYLGILVGSVLMLIYTLINMYEKYSIKLPLSGGKKC